LPTFAPPFPYTTLFRSLYVLCRGELGVEVRRYTWDDEDLGLIGGAGTADGKFQWPVALVLDRDERLYVSDEALNRITIMDRDGRSEEHTSELQSPCKLV